VTDKIPVIQRTEQGAPVILAFTLFWHACQRPAGALSTLMVYANQSIN